MHVVNFHITEQCNYSCRYCFAKFDSNNLELNQAIKLELNQAIKVVDNILDYFQVNNIKNGRINFAGGEPLLYPYLDNLIDYIAKKGYKSSIITNGTLLTAEKIAFWQDKISCIGISIDSMDSATNIQIGRQNNKKTLALSQIKELAYQIHKYGIEFKINTVLSKLNIDKDLLPLYLEVKPNKIKFLHVHILKNINDDDSIKELQTTKEEFMQCCSKYKNELSKELPHTKIIIEEKDSMENSYIMIDPSGNLILNDTGKYQSYGNLLHEPLTKLYNELPLNLETIQKRYIK